MTDILKYIDVNPNEAKKMAQRLHVKKDDIQLVRKGYDAKIEDQSDEERTITARVSTADVDRDGEVVEPKGIELKDYRSNPVLAWSHRYDVPAIGKALWAKADSGGLVCKFQFAETAFADDIYQLYKGGFMRAFSLGFIPVEYDQKTKTHKKINLLEVSAVLVPANQNALVMEAYHKGLIKSDALKKALEIPDEPSPAPIEEPPAVVEPEVKAVDEELATNAVDEAPGAAEDPEGESAMEVQEPTVKMFDTEQNPSIGDIMDAVFRALNPPSMMNEKPGAALDSFKDLWDLYPVDYPSGHCVYRQPGESGEPEYFLCDYIYDKGVVTLGDSAAPVVPAYAKRRGRGKGMVGQDAGSVCVKIKADTSEIEATLAALEARLSKLAEGVGTPASPASAVPPASDEMIEIDPDEEIEIDDDAAPSAGSVGEASQIMQAVARAIDNLDIKDIVENSVRLHLDKIRGRVR